MPLLETKGAASAQGFGEFAKVGAANYIEDVFSTWLYTGNGSTQTITNGIDLAGEGGLVWLKRRSGAANHQLYDTARGVGNKLASNETTAQASEPLGLTAFNATGFTLGSDGNANGSGSTNASWTFRKQPKFFDVVTYTGNGNSTQTISHNLGSTPGCIIIKATVTDSGQSNGNWIVFHRSIPNNFLMLNRTDAQSAQTGATTGTSTTFDAINGLCNGNGVTYVAYLFAHDAGGFGLTGTDNVISCGSFTTDGSGNATVSLGYEPQWVLYKRSDSSTGGSWHILDSMRGLTVTTDAQLLANTSDAETTGVSRIAPSATGFYNDTSGLVSNATYIYIAIRRGPMKTPTTGTSVFAPVTYTGTSSAQTISCSNLPDFLLVRRNVACDNNVYTRLTGSNRQLYTNLTLQEINQGTNYGVTAFLNTSWSFGLNANNENLSGEASIGLSFSRAPGFFDVVCYTGDGASGRTINHNLGVTPELIVVKRRPNADDWAVTSQLLGESPAGKLKSIYFNNTLPADNPQLFNTSGLTSTTFSIQQWSSVNQSGDGYVAYLFASCPGVSKVGSYTGTGTTQQINCGFTGGARFVLIKRTDSTGDWYVWDSARGIVAGNDPYLLLNSTATEVTNTDYVDTYSAGFEISSTAPAAINANGGTFVFLAVA